MLLIAAALLPGLADKRAISDISLLFNCSSLAAKTCSVTPLTTKYRSTIFSGVRRFSITAFDDGVVFLTLGIFGETSATTPRPFAPVEVIAGKFVVELTLSHESPPFKIFISEPDPQLPLARIKPYPSAPPFPL